MILSQFDSNNDSIINPQDIIQKINDFPKVGLSCYSKKLFDQWLDTFNATEIAHFKTEEGNLPIYKCNFNNVDIAIFRMRVGASTATMQFEEIIAMGVEKLVQMGSCGVLDKDIPLGHIIIPTSGIRDEGTSYHYAAANDEIYSDAYTIQKCGKILRDLSYHYTLGKVWTTDGFFRETREKMSQRKAAGCIAVDMEYTALQSVSDFRNVEYLQIFYSEDNLDSINWDKRGSIPNEYKKKYDFLKLGFEVASHI